MFNLKAEIRKEGEKRNGDIIPAVLYGPEIENSNILVDKKEFKKVFSEAGESSLIDLAIGGEKYPVLVYDFQKDPLSGDFIHIDFYKPNLKEEVETEVPVELVGEAPAVKNLGGTLIHNISVLNVKALPTDLPPKIEVDVGKIETFEDYIFVKDIKVSEKVKVLDDPEEIIAQVVAPQKEEVIEEKPKEAVAEEKPKEEAKPEE